MTEMENLEEKVALLETADLDERKDFLQIGLIYPSAS